MASPLSSLDASSFGHQRHQRHVAAPLQLYVDYEAERDALGVGAASAAAAPLLQPEAAAFHADPWTPHASPSISQVRSSKQVALFGPRAPRTQCPLSHEQLLSSKVYWGLCFGLNALKLLSDTNNIYIFIFFE
jgi:hypothetical protein